MLRIAGAEPLVILRQKTNMLRLLRFWTSIFPRPMLMRPRKLSEHLRIFDEELIGREELCFWLSKVM